MQNVVHVILTRRYPHRRLGTHSLMQPQLMRSRYALDATGSTAYVVFHPSSVSAQYQSSGLYSHIWVHMDWPHTCPDVHLDTLLVWHTLRVLLVVVGKFSCANVPFRVNSYFLTPLTLKCGCSVI